MLSLHVVLGQALGRETSQPADRQQVWQCGMTACVACCKGTELQVSVAYSGCPFFLQSPVCACVPYICV